MAAKKNYLKLVAIALAIVILITGALMLLEIWESKQGRFPQHETQEGVLTYKGKDYVRREGIETFLVLGIDKFKDADGSDSHESGSVQADFLMLFVFDNDAKTVTAIHINRDTMAKVNRMDLNGNTIETNIMQIALSYVYEYDDSGKKNCRNTADSVSSLLLGVPVDHYISLPMDSVIELNDLVGGVEVTVLDDFTGIDDALIKGEKVTLQGEQALRYVRSRQGLEDNTNTNRMARQQQYVEALFNQTMSWVETDEEFLLNAADKLMPYLVYDSTEYRMKELVKKFQNYEFTGIREIEGQSKAGQQFMEFHPDEDSIWQLVLELFCVPKTDKK